MQPIERYAVIALLFLVITIVAVLAWEQDPAAQGDEALALREEVPAARADGKRRPKREAENPAARSQTEERTQAGRPLPLEVPAETLPHLTRPRTEPETLRRQQEPDGTEVVYFNRPEESPTDTFRGLRAPEEEEPKRRDRDRGDRSDRGGDSAPRTAPARSEADEERPSSKPNRSEEARTYVVQAGDTLSEISQRELGTAQRWQEIVELNPGLNPRALREGARLTMPTGPTGFAGATEGGTRPGPRETSQPEPRTRAAEGERVYRIRSGDSLWTIAAAQLGDGARWNEIRELNPKLDPNKLYVGREIRLPEGPSRSTIASAERPRTQRPAPASSGERARVL